MQDKFRRHQNKFFERYLYLAEAYATKVWSVEKIGMEREDVIQELRLKIWHAIPEFIKRWKAYREEGEAKPVPMKYYIINVLNNKINDIIRRVKREEKNLLMSTVNFDFGVSVEDTFIDLGSKEKQAIIKGVDFFIGLEGDERKAFCFYLKGHRVKTIEKLLKGKVKNVSEVIRKQVRYIKEEHGDLVYETSRRYVTLEYEINN